MQSKQKPPYWVKWDSSSQGAMVLKLIAGSALTTDSVEVSSSSSRLVIHHGAELEHPCCPAVATNHGVRSLRDAEEEKCLMRSWQSRTFFIPLFFLLNPPSPSPHLVQSRRLLLQLLWCAEGLVDIGRKLLHLVVHQQLLQRLHRFKHVLLTYNQVCKKIKVKINKSAICCLCTIFN